MLMGNEKALKEIIIRNDIISTITMILVISLNLTDTKTNDR